MKAIFYGFQFPHHGRFSAFNGFRESLGEQGVEVLDVTWPKLFEMRGFRRLHPPLMKFQERRLWSRVKKGKYDLVHYFFPENSIFEAVHEKRTNEKLVLTLHLPGGQAYLDEIAVKNPPLHQAIRSADGIILMAPDDLELYQKFAAKSRVVFLPHGVDTDFFAPPTEPVCAGPKRVLTVGNMLRDYEFWAQTVCEASRLAPDLKFTVIASQRHIERVLPIFGGALPPQVEWLAGISDQELRAQYAKASLLFLPLQQAWANNALLEACAMGVPIMVTDLPACRAYLEETGIYFQNEAPREVAGRLLQLLEDQNRMQELRRALRKRALEELRWNIIATKYRDFYQSLLQNETRNENTI